LWALIVLAILVLLVVLALSVPLSFIFQLEVYGNFNLNLKLNWLFGLVDRELPTTSPGKNLGKRFKRRIGLRTLWELLQTKGLFMKLKEWLKETVRCLRLKELRGDFIIGLDDPEDTGLLFSFIYPLTPFLEDSRLRDIQLQPSFKDEAICEGYLRGKVRVIPIQLVPPFLKLFFSLPTLRALKTLASGRGK
jgi:hypothetical protein